MGIDPGLWKGRRVLITGHTGFKGGWLALWLKTMEADVAGLALPPSTQPNLFELACVVDGMASVMGDIRQSETLAGAFLAHRPEIVFHLAAQPLVRASYAHPVETYATNVMGTLHLLEAARCSGTVRAIVIVTSDKCYENREWPWPYREDDKLGGHDPYSSSKACAELVTAAYRNSYLREAGIAAASVRAGNVIGGGDWAQDRLIPDMMRAFSAGQTVRLRDPEAVRPWQHVLDPLCGYLLLAQKLFHEGGSYAEGWNFGPDSTSTRTVSWVAENVASLWGKDARCTRDMALHPHEARTLSLDSSKARSRLGWRPRWSIEQALSETVQWYRAYSDGASMRGFSLHQLRRYVETRPA